MAFREGSYLGIPEQSHYLWSKDREGAKTGSTESVFSVVRIRGLPGV